MNMTVADIANGMRLTSHHSSSSSTSDIPSVGNHPDSQKTVAGIVVLTILLLHMFRVMTILMHDDTRMCDFLPTVVTLFGCALYARDSFCGMFGTGLIKLTICMVIAHLVLPNVWDTPETRWAEYHVRESQQQQPQPQEVMNP